MEATKTLIDNKRLDDLDRCIELASAPGHYDDSSYMLGMANGLILAKSILDHKNPEYLLPPKKGYGGERKTAKSVLAIISEIFGKGKRVTGVYK